MDEDISLPISNGVKKPSETQTPIEELIQLQKNNNELLQIMAGNQTILLELAQESNRNAKMNRWFVALKYAFWVILIYVSFFFTQNLMQSMIGNIPGFGGGAGLLESAKSLGSNSENVPSDLLNQITGLLGQ